MDTNSKKILKFLCKNKDKHFNFITLAKEFPNMDKSYIIEIVNNFNKQDYILYTSDSKFKITNKGETYLHTSRMTWLSKNIVSILALIVSTLALIEATIALILE